jgi:hypothetical protein
VRLTVGNAQKNTSAKAVQNNGQEMKKPFLKTRENENLHIG